MAQHSSKSKPRRKDEAKPEKPERCGWKVLARIIHQPPRRQEDKDRNVN